jgi:hypothetical protein
MGSLLKLQLQSIDKKAPPEQAARNSPRHREVFPVLRPSPPLMPSSGGDLRGVSGLRAARVEASPLL